MVTQKEIQRSIKKVFGSAPWVKTFLSSDHHGIAHGEQIRIQCLKLIEELTPSEKKQLIKEGKTINSEDPFTAAKIAVAIAAVFHDAGRYGNNGKMAKNQMFHHCLSAKRVKKFCLKMGISEFLPLTLEAVLCHDYQSKKVTPYLQPPQSMIGKIVQAVDQIRWFHPDCVYRTLDFNNSIGIPFYDPQVTMEQRLNWQPGIHSDAVTVLMNQLFGPTGRDRFAITVLRHHLFENREKLETEILKVSRQFGLEETIKKIIVEYGRLIKK